MAEVRRVTPTIVEVHAHAELLDALTPEEAIVHRVAPDEAMVTGIAQDGTALLATVEGAVAADEGAVVLDVSDGWAVWAIGGSDARLAFSRVSRLPLPDAGMIQGDVLRLPARIGATAHGIVLFVPASYGAWVERKLVERCPEIARIGQVTHT